MVSICVFVFFVLSQALSFGQAISLTEQKQYEARFSQSQKNLKTFSAQLKQSLQLEGMKQPVISQGKLWLQNPQGWLLIRYNKPDGEFILLRDAKLFIKKRGKPLKTETVDKEKKNSLTMLRRFFQEGAEAWKEDFNVTIIKEEPNLKIILIPKLEDKTQPKVIETLVNLKTFLPQEIRLSFEGNNQLVYQFSKIQRNTSLPSDLFTAPL